MLAILLAATLAATEPFPLDHAGNAELARLREAWRSPATDPSQRAELAARLREAAALRAPDWRAVAEGYFAWRNAAASAENAHWQEIWHLNRRAMGAAPTAPLSVCTTETRNRPDTIWGGSNSSSTTKCYGSAGQ